MKFSQLVANLDISKQDRLWLWHPTLSENLPWIKEQGLQDPFLFGKRKNAAELRLPKDRILLRIAREQLIESNLIRDLSLRHAQNSCKQGCWELSDFRRWMNSLPLKQGDILTRWSQGQGFQNQVQQQLVIALLGKLDSHGFWQYQGNINAKNLSWFHPSGYYVTL